MACYFFFYMVVSLLHFFPILCSQDGCSNSSKNVRLWNPKETVRVRVCVCDL